MPERRAAPLLSAIQAFNEGGIEPALEYLDPEIEWLAPPEWLEDRLYKGHDGMRRLSTHWTQLFDDYRVEPERELDVGDDEVVLLLHQRGRIRGSGDSVESPIGYLARIRGGLVTKVSIYFSWEATLEAAGVPEGRETTGLS
jgi:ketosteroid isomerase-like protein